jgi:hypothetical protein
VFVVVDPAFEVSGRCLGEGDPDRPFGKC